MSVDLSQAEGEITDLSTYEARQYNLLDWKGRGYAMKSDELVLEGWVPPTAITEIPLP